MATDDQVSLRKLQKTDAIILVSLANNKKIADNIRDIFPQPYTEKDANDFITLCEREKPILNFAVLFGNNLAGVIGLLKMRDVYRNTAEIGYWLGEPFWNKGIATSAIKLMTKYAFEQLDLKRLQCGVFEYNKSSMRALEKADFQFEAIFKKSLFKNGQFWNEYRYGKVNPDLNSVDKLIPSFNQVTLKVFDLNRSMDFYLQLGLKIIVKTDHYIRFETPGNRSTFSLDLATQNPGNCDVTLYFEYENLDSAIQKFNDTGIMTTQKIKDQSWLWREIKITDPDGYSICLYQAGKNRLSPPWRYKENKNSS